MTEHEEKLVREWRKAGIPFDSVCMIFAIAEMTGRAPAEVADAIVKHGKDIKKTLYNV